MKRIHAEVRRGVKLQAKDGRDGGRGTSTKNPVVRLLYVVEVSLLLRNLWICLRGSYVAVKRRGRHGRKVLEDEFRYRKMIEMIKQALNDLFGAIRKSGRDNQ